MTNNRVSPGDDYDAPLDPTVDNGSTSTSAAPLDASTTGTTGSDVTGYEEPARVDTRGGGMGNAWFTLVIGAILLIVLLVFVLQNLDQVQVAFLAWEFSMPIGVVILFAAIIGALVMALLAAMRILQLRHRARAANKRPKAKRR